MGAENSSAETGRKDMHLEWRERESRHSQNVTYSVIIFVRIQSIVNGFNYIPPKFKKKMQKVNLEHRTLIIQS